MYSSCRTIVRHPYEPCYNRGFLGRASLEMTVFLFFEMGSNKRISFQVTHGVTKRLFTNGCTYRCLLLTFTSYW
jgi:hypothetical protein